MFCKSCNKQIPRHLKYFCNKECHNNFLIKRSAINNFKNCPICDKSFQYKGHAFNKHKKFCSRKCYSVYLQGKESSFKNHRHTEKTKRKMSEFQRGKIISESTKKKLSKIGLGRKFSEEHCRKIKESLLGSSRTPEAKTNMRLARIKWIEKMKLGGRQLSPASNPRACEYFKNFDEEHHTHGKFASNGKEFFIKKLGFWVDYINHDLKLIMEYDEKGHYFADGSLRKKDIERQELIEKAYPDYRFIRIKE